MFSDVSLCRSSRFQASAQCSFPAQSTESSLQHIVRQPNCSAHRGQLPLAHPALSPPAGPQRQRHRWGTNRQLVTDSMYEIGPSRVGHRWQEEADERVWGVKRTEEAVVHERDFTPERPLYLTSWNTITPVCGALCLTQACMLLGSLIHVLMCVLYDFVCPSAWIPLKSSPSPQHLPSPSRKHKHTCALWHFPPSVFSLSIRFPSFLSFPLFSFLSVFSLQLSFIYAFSCYSFLCSPSCAPLLPLSLLFSAFLLSYTLLLPSQGQRRGLSWLLWQPSLFTYWPATEWSCRWMSQSQSPSPCWLTVAWRKMITSLLGDLTRALVCNKKALRLSHLRTHVSIVC